MPCPAGPRFSRLRACPAARPSIASKRTKGRENRPILSVLTRWMPGVPFFSLFGVPAPVARSIPCLESALAEPAPCGSVRRTCGVGMCGIFLVHYRLERCLGMIRETPANLLGKLEHRESAPCGREPRVAFVSEYSSWMKEDSGRRSLHFQAYRTSQFAKRLSV